MSGFAACRALAGPVEAGPVAAGPQGYRRAWLPFASMIMTVSKAMQAADGMAERPASRRRGGGGGGGGGGGDDDLPFTNCPPFLSTPPQARSLANTLNVVRRRLAQLQGERAHTKEDLAHFKVWLG